MLKGVLSRSRPPRRMAQNGLYGRKRIRDRWPFNTNFNRHLDGMDGRFLLQNRAGKQHRSVHRDKFKTGIDVRSTNIGQIAKGTGKQSV